MKQREKERKKSEKWATNKRKIGSSLVRKQFNNNNLQHHQANPLSSSVILWNRLESIRVLQFHDILVTIFFFFLS